MRRILVAGLHGLVDDAGIGTGGGARFADVLRVNILGDHRVCETFLPPMMHEGDTWGTNYPP